MKHFLDVGGFEIGRRGIADVAGFLAEELGAFAEGDAAAGFAQAEEADDCEGDVGEALDSFDPAPAQGLVDEAGVDGGADCSENGDVGEAGHGDGTFFRTVHVTKGTTDQDGANAAEETEQGTADNDRSDVLTQGETDKHQTEADVCTDIDDTATSKLAERSQEEGSQGTCEVEGKETQLPENSGYTEVFCHAVDTRTVGCCCETDEEGHETEEQRDKGLVTRVPVERVLLVTVDEVDEDTLLSIMDGSLCSGKGDIEVKGLEVLFT